MMLRPYQERAIADLRSQYAAGRRAPCLVAPTGSGKTVIGAEIVRLARERGKHILFNAHRAELIEQTARKLADAGITDVRTIKAQVGKHGNAPVTVASVQTLTNYADADMPAADLVVFDECHHGPAQTFRRIADFYSKAQLLGLTATPARADGKPLGDLFDSLVVAASVKELTEAGHLVPCRVWAPPDVLDTGQLALSPVDAYIKHGGGQRGFAFCVSIEHAEQVAQEFNARGITSTVLHGNLSKTVRAQILAWFRDGQIRMLTSVHVLSEGFDEPSAAVAILCRKPDHVGTYLQIVGRVLRPHPDKSQAIVIDLCGSSLVHGTPDMERKYSLNGKAISSPEREAIRQCPTCGGVFLLADVTDGACTQCGAALPRRVLQPPRAVNVGLVENNNTDQLRINLQAAARRTRRAAEWVERAHAAIMRRSA